MLYIAGRAFAESEREFEAASPPPVGLAKRSRNVIHLHRPDGELVGAVTSGGVIGAACRLDNGRAWYSYGDCQLLPPLSLSDMVAAVSALAVDRSWKGTRLLYHFKAGR